MFFYFRTQRPALTSAAMTRTHTPATLMIGLTGNRQSVSRLALWLKTRWVGIERRMSVVTQDWVSWQWLAARLLFLLIFLTHSPIKSSSLWVLSLAALIWSTWPTLTPRSKLSLLCLTCQGLWRCDSRKQWIQKDWTALKYTMLWYLQIIWVFFKQIMCNPYMA